MKSDFHTSSSRNSKRKCEDQNKGGLAVEKQEEMPSQYEGEPEIPKNHWMELNRALKRRVKTKKQKVDTKTSKGRKTRYVEIPKLVNFFPATPERISWTHGRRDELFKSLFV